MRYRIDESLEQVGAPVGHGPLLLGAVLSLVIGIGFVVLGLRSRHYWLSLWGSGLACASIAYLVLSVLSP